MKVFTLLVRSHNSVINAPKKTGAYDAPVSQDTGTYVHFVQYVIQVRGRQPDWFGMIILQKKKKIVCSGTNLSPWMHGTL